MSGLTGEATHTGDLAAPFTGKEGDILDKGKICTERAESNTLSHRLSELKQEYYLFALGPLYAGMQLNVDLVYQFGVDMHMSKVENLVTYQSPVPLFADPMGGWEFILQGLPHNMKTLFEKYVLQTVFTRLDKKPKQYWRTNIRELTINTPGEVYSTAPVSVFTLTGVDRRLEPRVLPDGKIGFFSAPPEGWLVKQAMDYFLAQ